MEAAAAASSAASPLRNPVVLSILIMEIAERAAYFGFRAILVLYFTQGLHYDDATAVSLFAATSAFAYLSPLVGALLADARWGRYVTILRFARLYVTGLLLLTLAAYHTTTTTTPPPSSSASSLLLERVGTFVGLFFVCTGTGGIKPCVSAFGADQVVLSSSVNEEETTSDTTTTSQQESSSTSNSVTMEMEYKENGNNTTQQQHQDHNGEQQQQQQQEQERRVREYFNAFYFCINVGALTSFLCIPMVRAHYGFGAAFLVPTVLMLVAIVVFRSQQHQYKHRPLPNLKTPEEEEENAANSATMTARRRKRTESTPPPNLLDILRVCVRIVQERFFRHTTLGRWMVHHHYCPGGHYQRISPTPSLHAGFEKDTTATASSLSLKRKDAGGGGGIGDGLFVIDETSLALQEQKEEKEDTTQNNSNTNTMHETVTSSSTVYEDAAQALHILPIFMFFPIFWMLYDQQGSVWTIQATHMNLHGYQPEQLGIINPLQIMILIPVFDRIIYPYLERTKQQQQQQQQRRQVGGTTWTSRIGTGLLQPIRRMEYGMLLTAVSFFMSAYLEHHIQRQQQHPGSSFAMDTTTGDDDDDGNTMISVLWQIPQITILTIAEIFLSVTGLEFAYSQAPKSMQTLLLALFLLTTTLGDFLGSGLYATIFANMDTVVSMIICAVCMLLNLAAFSYTVGNNKWQPYHHKPADNSVNETEEEEEEEEEKNVPPRQ